MSIAKISSIVGASIITAGSSAAVATRDKWWPKEENRSISEKQVDNGQSQQTRDKSPEEADPPVAPISQPGSSVGANPTSI